jgi:hypothetical protein
VVSPKPFGSEAQAASGVAEKKETRPDAKPQSKTETR